MAVRVVHDPTLPIASRRHTIIMVAIFLVVAAAGVWSRAQSGRPGAVAVGPASASTAYLSIMAAELGLVFYVWRGTRRHLPSPLIALTGVRWEGMGALSRDVILAAALWGAWLALQFLFNRLLPATQGAPRGLLPRGLVDGSMWVMVSVVAGVAEELVFRGYFMQQLRALTGRMWLALLLQAALFGIAHGYEGIFTCIRIIVFGLLFGLMALWQRNLRACILAHAWTDIAAGLLGI